MTRAVFDANVLASGVLGLPREESVPGELLRRWFLGRFDLIVSERLLDELEHHAFAKDYFLTRVSLDAQREVLALLRAESTVTDLTAQVEGVAPDPDDDHVLAAAVSSAADYLVTGDRALRALGSYQGVTIVTPREFVELLASDEPA